MYGKHTEGAVPCHLLYGSHATDSVQCHLFTADEGQFSSAEWQQLQRMWNRMHIVALDDRERDAWLPNTHYVPYRCDCQGPAVACCS